MHVSPTNWPFSLLPNMQEDQLNFTIKVLSYRIVLLYRIIGKRHVIRGKLVMHVYSTGPSPFFTEHDDLWSFLVVQHDTLTL